MKATSLICISCPLGCEMTAKVENGEVISVDGNSCLRGEKYAKKELINPERTVTSTVRLKGGDTYLVSVKTEQEIPKSKIKDVMNQINSCVANSPVKVGDIIMKDICATGVNLVATKNA